MTEPDPIDPVAIDFETDFLRYENRYRWRDVDENVDRFNAALEEWLKRGEEAP